MMEAVGGAAKAMLGRTPSNVPFFCYRADSR
jgi:actin-like ATPase involved in cell morphogenesis